MPKIVLNPHHAGFEAVLKLNDEVFHGVGKNKKEALRDLRSQINVRLRKLDNLRFKLLSGIGEVNSIIHTPALLNGE